MKRGLEVGDGVVAGEETHEGQGDDDEVLEDGQPRSPTIIVLLTGNRVLFEAQRTHAPLVPLPGAAV